MKRILLSTFALLIGGLNAYSQCPGGGGASQYGVLDDMAVVNAATDTTVPGGYPEVNWYPKPDSVINKDSVNDSNYKSYQIYHLSRIQVGGDWKMQVKAHNADSLFATFGIGFPATGIDLSQDSTMSIDIDNSAQPGVPLYFTANITDWNFKQLQYMSDTLTGFAYYYANYDNWYKKKYTDTISASNTTVNTSYHTTGYTQWPGRGQSANSTTSASTTVHFNFGHGYPIQQSFSDTATTNGGLEDFPCGTNPGGSGHNFTYYCPKLDTSAQRFDWQHVVSIAFYFNGGGILKDSTSSMNNPSSVNPDPSTVTKTGVSFPVFNGTVLLDNFRLGTNNGCCWQYVYPTGFQCVPGIGTAVTAATSTSSSASLVPNPASDGQVTIKDNSGASSYSITVTNTLGTVVKTATGTSFDAPTAAGMYFVTYTANSNGNSAPKTLQLVVK